MDNKPNNNIPIVAKEYRLYFFLLVFCFALWGLLNNMNDTLVPAFAKIFMIKAVDSSLVQVAFYGAYAVLAMPAAFIIKKYSYRVGVLVGLGFYMVGAFGYVPAALLQNYNLFLVSIFVLACGLSVLETTCNPFVLSLGAQETSVRRLNFAQAFNPVGSIAGLFLAKYLILANLNPADLDARMAMSADELAAIRHTELFWICVPYIGLIFVAVILWLIFFKSKLNEKDARTAMTVPEAFKKLFSKPRYYWGVFTQFFYVGVQVAVWTWTIKYIMTTEHIVEHEAVDYFSRYNLSACQRLHLVSYCDFRLHEPDVPDYLRYSTAQSRSGSKIRCGRSYHGNSRRSGSAAGYGLARGLRCA